MITQEEGWVGMRFIGVVVAEWFRARHISAAPSANKEAFHFTLDEIKLPFLKQKIKLIKTCILDLGFPGGKSKSLYGRDGHLGTTLIKFSGDQLGLKEALRLAEHFEKENHGRRAWGRIQPVTLGKDDEKNPDLVKIERSGEKKRILYGYLGTASDLYKVDFETRKKVAIESQREYKASK